MHRAPPRGRRNRPHGPRVEALERRQLLASLAVSNTADSGPGSLRQAILDANADTSAGVVNVGFSIPGAGVHAIAPLSPLPAIGRPVLLDGTSEPGYAGAPLVALDGSHAGPAGGLTLAVGADGGTVLGLAIGHFGGAGITVDAPRVSIRGDYLGVDADGATAAGNAGDGIDLVGAPFATIGGTAAGDGNVISANAGFGIATTIRVQQTYVPTYSFNESDSSPSLFQGNEIGTDASGRHALGNGKGGIDLGGAASRDTIGGTAAGAGNVISGNGGDGIRSETQTIYIGDGTGYVGVSREQVLGNFIGTDRSASLDLGNQGGGVLFLSSGGDDTVGGTAAGAGNTIAFNRGKAVDGPLTQLTIVGNRFLGGTPQAAIGVTVAGSNANSKLYDYLPFHFTLTNHGPDTATNLAFSLTLPQADFMLKPGPTVIVSNSYLGNSYRVASLAAGASASIEVDVLAASPELLGPRSLDLVVTGLDQVDTDTTIGRASASYVAALFPDLKLATAFSPDPPAAKHVSTATFTVTNSGLAPATATRLTLNFSSPGTTVDAVRVSQGTAPAPGDFAPSSHPFADLGTLAPGASATVAVDFTAPATGEVNVSAAPSSFEEFATPIFNTTYLKQVVGPTFTVSNTADSGLGSLRQAILDADADTSAGLDTIGFAIPGPGYSYSGPGVQTIAPASALPAITRPLVIDGTTQPGYAGTPLVALDGSSAGQAAGLTLGPGSDGSGVIGLEVGRFGGDGLDLDGTSGVTIRGNWIGDLTGIPGGNGGNGGNGIALVGSTATIGGTAADAGNVISGNAGDGIALSVAVGPTIFYGPGPDVPSQAVIQGNFIGTYPGGTTALGNGASGIDVQGDATIGGTAAGAGNVIAGNGGDGIRTRVNRYFPPLGEGSNRTTPALIVVQGNAIGTDPAGKRDLGNGGSGVDLSSVYGPYGFALGGTLGGAGSDSTAIGGTAAGAGNVIAFNRGPAIRGLDGIVVGNRLDVPAASSAIIGVSASGSGAGIGVGDPAPLIYTVTNFGPSDATNLRLLLNSDSSASAVSYTVEPGPATIPTAQPVGVEDGATILLIPRLAAGASDTVRVDVTARPPSPSTNGPGVDDLTLRVYDLDQVDADTTSGFASASFASTPDLSALTLTGSLSPAAPVDNHPATATFTLANTGTTPARGVELGLSLDRAASVQAVRVGQVTIPGAEKYLTPGSSPLFPLGSIDPGATVTVSVDLTPIFQFPISLFASAQSTKVGGSAVQTVNLDATVGPTFAVTTTADAGPGSLRQAILDADADPAPGTDSIGFAIPGTGVQRITPASALPAITRPLSIDGTSQSGYGALLTVVLDGSTASAGGVPVDGLVVAAGADRSMIRGLEIVRFSGSGVVVAAANVALTQDAIGTDPTGTQDLGNGGLGIDLRGSGGILADDVIAFNGPHPAPAQADLGIAAVGPPPSAQLGQLVPFTFVVSNRGPGDAADAVVALDLTGFGGDPYFSIAARSGAGGPVPGRGPLGPLAGSPGFYLVDLGPLAASASATVEVDVIPTGPGPISLSAAVSDAGRPDANPADNLALAGTTATPPAVPARADLGVAAVAPPLTTPVGRMVPFTFVVSNHGPGAAADAVVAVDLGGLGGDRYFSIAARSGSGGPVPGRGPLGPLAGSPGFYLVDLGPLAASASAVVEVDLIPTSSGLVALSAAVSDAGRPDANPADNLAFAATLTSPAVPVIDAEPRTAGGRIAAIQVDFGVGPPESKAEDLRNYRLATAAGAPVAIRSARLDAAGRGVLLRLARPLPSAGLALRLVVGGPGSPGLAGFAIPVPVDDSSVATIGPARRRPGP